MTNRNAKTGLLYAVAWGLIFASGSAWCGPPFVTDDAEPVEYRHHEMYIASEQVSSQGSKEVTPVVEYNYGALPDLQLSIAIPYVFSSPAGQTKQQGLGDLELGVKYRFVQETADQPMMAIYPIAVAPTGNANKGLGNGRAQFFLPVWIQKRWGGWQSSGGGGYWFNNTQGVGNNWYFGWQLQYDISEQITVGGEVFHTTDQLPADNSSTGYSLGGIYKLDQNNRFLVSLRRGQADVSSRNTFSSYIGYGTTW